MKIYESMPNSEYHSLKDYISSSFVKSVAKHSIAKALQPLEPSQALLFGDAMHTYFEDQEAYNQRFKVLPIGWRWPSLATLSAQQSLSRAGWRLALSMV